MDNILALRDLLIRRMNTNLVNYLHLVHSKNQHVITVDKCMNQFYIKLEKQSHAYFVTFRLRNRNQNEVSSVIFIL